MGPRRRDTVLGRCLCGPPLVWRGRGGQTAGGGRPARVHSAATRLARRPARLQAPGTSAPVLRHQSRVHGLHGEQVHGCTPPEERGRILAGRQARHAPRVPYHSLHAMPETTVPRRARGARWHRGFAKARGALRLLAGEHTPVDTGGLRRRHDNLRHGRQGEPGTGEPPGSLHGDVRRKS